MDRSTDRKALKLQALAALDEARRELGAQAVRARIDFAPRALFLHGFQKYRIWVVVASAAAGFFAVRMLLPSRRRIDKKSKPATNRSVTGLLLTGLWTLARAPLIDFARDQLQSYVMNRVAPTTTSKQTDFPK
jgi:hypothetical protein